MGVTGAFVERAVKLAQPDNDMIALELRKQELAEQEHLRRICKELDADGSGTISAEECIPQLSGGRHKAYFKALGIDVKHAEAFFEMLATASDSREVDIEDFIRGCS